MFYTHCYKTFIMKAYIKAFKERKIKRIEKEILTLQKQLELVKTQTERWDF